QISADFAHRLILVGGELKWEEPANPRIDGGGDAQTRGPLPVAQLATAKGQGQLKHEKFLVDEAAPAGTGVGHRFGKVDLLQRALHRGEAMPVTKLGGQDFRDLAAVE